MTRGRTTLLLLLSGRLVATGCGGGSPSDPTSARGRVEALSRALVEADGTALVAVVQDPSYDISTALLTDAVLGEGALAGQEVDVEKTDGDLETIRYALGVGDSEPWLEPRIRRGGAFVGLPLPQVTLRGPGVTSVTIGGVTVGIDPLPDEGQAFYLPPGEYDVGVGGGGRFVTHGGPRHVDTPERGPDVLEYAGRLSLAGRARVDRAVGAFVRRCTRPVRGSRPAACPASKAFVGGLDSSEWTLASLPRTTVEANGDGWLVSTPDPPVARMKDLVRDRETGASEPVTDRVRFAVSGTVTLRGDDLVVELAG
jgi:hypothetical protein